MHPEARGSDSAAWLERHGDALWRYALGRLRNPDLAEELIQETLVAAWRGRDGFRGESSERTWLLSILRRKMSDHHRRGARDRRASSTEREPVGGALGAMFGEDGRWKMDPGRPPGAGVLESPEFMADFERCLAKMPAGLAEAFLMREARGAASEAVCAAMQISLDNLWVRLHRARVLLRKCLSLRWGPGTKGGC